MTQIYEIFRTYDTISYKNSNYLTLHLSGGAYRCLPRGLKDGRDGLIGLGGGLKDHF